MSGAGIVDLTGEASLACGGGDAGNSETTLHSLKEALAAKKQERKEAERVLNALMEEEEDLLVSIQAIEAQEASEQRDRNRPDWAGKFEWDHQVLDLLKRIFKLPKFRPLQHEVHVQQ